MLENEKIRKKEKKISKNRNAILGGSQLEMEPSGLGASIEPEKSLEGFQVQKLSASAGRLRASLQVQAADPLGRVPRAPLADEQLLSQAERVVVVAHTAELRLTEAEMRKAEGVQADAPVEQVAAAVGLRVAAELHRMWASPCSVWSQCAHGAVQVRGTETEFLGEGLAVLQEEVCVRGLQGLGPGAGQGGSVEAALRSQWANTLPGVAPGVPMSAQPAVEAVGTWVAGKLRQMWATDNSTWVECEHGAVCASSEEGQQCQFAGTVCSRPGCVKKAQEWWVPIVSAAKQHVTASDGVGHAGGSHRQGSVQFD